MDVGKSLRICRAKTGMTNIDVARHLGISKQRASLIANTQHASTKTVEKLARLFNMSASEFIKLGEDDDDC